jgi:Cu/Ag efflux pump CusA
MAFLRVIKGPCTVALSGVNTHCAQALFAVCHAVQLPLAGLPVLTIKLDRAALSRYGISVGDVQSIVEIAMGGKSTGFVFEGDRRFELVVRVPERERSDIDAIKAIPIPLPAA